MCVCAKSLQLCPTLCDPMDHGLPGSSVRGILQQEYWSGLPCPPPGIFPTQGSNPCLLRLLHWPTGSLPLAPPGKPQLAISQYKIKSKKKKFTFFFLTALLRFRSHTMYFASLKHTVIWYICNVGQPPPLIPGYFHHPQKETQIH